MESIIVLDGGVGGTENVIVRLRAGLFPELDATVVFLGLDANGAIDETLSESTTAPAAEGYRYSMRLRTGRYYVVAGIDDDRDEQPFENGERAGFWRNTDNLESIEVLSNSALTGIDFDLAPQASLGATAAPIPLR